MQAERVVRQVVENSPGVTTKENRKHLLKSLATFAGGGGPRFWFSVSPEMPQTNYAQMIVEVTDKEASPKRAAHSRMRSPRKCQELGLLCGELQTNPVEIR